MLHRIHDGKREIEIGVDRPELRSVVDGNAAADQIVCHTCSIKYI